MDFIQFIKDNLAEGYDFKIAQDLSFNFDDKRDNVILRLQQGNRYKKGVVIPITILVTSDDVETMRQVWTDWVNAVSDENYIEGTDNYYMVFMSPSIVQTFDEVSNNFYSVLTIMGTIVETNNTNDIKKFEVSWGSTFIELDIINIGLSLVYTQLTEQKKNETMMKTSNIGSVLSLSLTTYIDDNDFFNMLRSMRNGVSNVDFVCRLTWNNGDIETHSMQLTRQGFVKTRGELSVVTIDFTK